MTSQGIFFHTSLVFHFRGQSWSQKPMSNLSFPRRFAEMTSVNQNSGITVSFWKFPLQCLFKSSAEFTECPEQPCLFWHWLMNKTKLPQEEILRKACSSVSSRRKRRDKRKSGGVPRHRQGCFTVGAVEKLRGFMWQNRRKGRGEKQSRGEEKTRKRQKKDLGCLYPGIQAVGLNWLYYLSLEGLGNHAGNWTGIWLMLVT